MKLKRAWSNGVTHLKLTGPELIERLVSLVPRPRTHLVRYHGVLAPNARLRGAVVQQAAQQARSKKTRKRFNWAELMMRVFELDVTRCPNCGANGMQVIACIDEPNAVYKILIHIGEPAAPPHFEPAIHRDTFTAP